LRDNRPHLAEKNHAPGGEWERGGKSAPEKSKLRRARLQTKGKRKKIQKTKASDPSFVTHASLYNGKKAMPGGIRTWDGKRVPDEEGGKNVRHSSTRRLIETASSRLRVGSAAGKKRKGEKRKRARSLQSSPVGDKKETFRLSGGEGIQNSRSEVDLRQEEEKVRDISPWKEKRLHRGLSS